jgi:hypothetical protein
MTIDIDGYREYMARKDHARSLQSADNTVSEFIAKGEQLTAAVGGNRSLYHRASQHHTEYRVQGVSVADDNE